MKPYRRILIEECGDPLIPIPQDFFCFTEPHPYEAFGAPYDSDHPWQLRAGVIEKLLIAATVLHRQKKGFKLKLFDAYRTNRVQSFMVHHEFKTLSGGLSPSMVPPDQREVLWQKTLRIWAEPSDDPLTPPPHSTGAAMDLTLIDGDGQEIDMGSPIDENSDRSSPDYFEARDGVVHQNRGLLFSVMKEAGFTRHPEEWWHFSFGDQMWAFLNQPREDDKDPIARYGRADLLAKGPRT